MKIKKLKKVMVFGTFDIFHLGHKNFLQQAKKYGDYLISVIARDKTVIKVKNKKPQNNEKIRLENIKNSNLVDKTVLGNLIDKYIIINKYKPDIICLGYDQKVFTEKIKEKLKEFKLEKTKIIKLKSYYPNKYKSSKIKNYGN